MSEKSKIENRKSKIEPLLLLLLFAFFAWLYASMGPPGLDWGDAAEAQLAAWRGGLSHPTGYPLFLMLGWLWTHALAPLGVEPTRAMTLLSAALAAGSAALLVPVVSSFLARGRLPLSAAERAALGAGAALFFGLSSTFWAQALRAEVYSLHTLLLLAFLLALWKGKARTAALLLGLALSHHRTALMWLPGLAFCLWWERRGPIPWRRLAGLALLVALPQLLYLYIPLRAPLTEYLRQPIAGNESLVLYDGSAAAFAEHVLGTRFAGDLTVRGSLGERVAAVALLARSNILAILGMIMAALGMFVVVRTVEGARTLRWSDRVLVALGGFLTFAFGFFFAVDDAEVYFIPTWLAATILIWGGLGLLLAAMKQQSARWPRLVIVAMGALLVAMQLHAAPDSRATLVEPRALATRVLEGAPPNAIVLSNDRDEIVPLWYAQFAEGQRRDVLVLAPLLRADESFSDVSALGEWALQRGRPVVLLKEMPGLDLRFDLSPAEGGLWAVEGTAPLPEGATGGTLLPGVTVAGWALEPARPAPGERTVINVALRVEAPPTVNPALSLQLFDAAGERVAQADRAPATVVPATEWRAGETLRLPMALDLPADLPPGAYQWRLSAYLPTADGGFEGLGEQLTIAEVEIGR